MSLALAVAFPLAHAQNAPEDKPAEAAPAAPAASASAPAAREASSQVLDKVVIQASRRREPVRQVPLRVDVLSAEGLERQGASSLVDYLATTPGVSLQSNGGQGMGPLSMRGVTTGADPSTTVGVYVDDVATGSNGASAGGSGRFFDMGLLDLHHIEVLRGPQGTLYGAASVGGLLKYVTHTPDASGFSGKVSIGGSSTREGGSTGVASGVLNLPLQQDVAALRVSAYKSRDGGWVDASGPAGGRDVNRGESWGARASLLVTPNKDLSLRVTATAQDIQREGRDFVQHSPADSQPVEGELSRGSLSVREPYRSKNQLFSAEVEYDFGFARLNSITSYQTLAHSNTIDASAIYVPLLAGFGINVDTVDVRIPVSTHRSSQEIRLISKADPKFEWLAGLYLDREGARQTQYAESTVAGAPGPLLAYFDIPSHYDEDALFGDATYKFDAGFSLTGGLRVARNKQRYVQESSGPLAGGSASIDASSSDTSRTFLLTGGYTIDAQSNAYVRVASGYRPGGPNTVLRDLNTGQFVAPPTFEPDTLVSTELGYKGLLLERTLSIDAAIFNVDWKDIQQSSAVNGVNVIVNTGKARIRGVEAALNYTPSKLGSFGVGATYIDAKLTEDAPGLGATSGQRLPNTAKFSMSLQGTANFELAGYASYAGFVFRRVGERDAGFEGSAAQPSYKLPAYSLTDLNAGIDFGRFNLALYARNVFDKRAQTSAYTAFLPLGGNALVSVAQPRTLGATLTAPF